MITLTFRPKNSAVGSLRLGIKTDQGILDVLPAGNALGLTGFPLNPDAFFAAGSGAVTSLKSLVERALASPDRDRWIFKEEDISYGPCVPHPGKILCVGLNYRQHAAESKMAVPPVPVLFPKYQNSIAASGEAVPLPKGVYRFDYEAELGVVIGSRARYVPAERALGCVLGYCNANDISERERQGQTSQWLPGKAIDKFLPIGPYLLTADEVPDPQKWPIRLWLNGEMRQDSSTSDMIFSVAQIISFISQFMTLEPGDFIATGTPQGVILGKEHKVWMKAGDEMTVEVGSLGKLTNTLIKDPLAEGEA